MEEQIKRIIEGLKCSRAEAEEIYKADKAIDRGERMDFDLSPEQEKEAKKMVNATTKKKPVNYDFSKRQRKENATKGSIIAELARFLEQGSENACTAVTITNKERQIAFTIGSDSFELTLVQKRKPKGV